MRLLKTFGPRPLTALALGVCQLGVLAIATGADVPSAATPNDVKSLIARLGDPSFAAREAATTRLAEMDVSVRPALQAATKSRDAEVRSRARRILATVNERYLQQRLAAFAADVEDKQRLDLPGWSRFQAIVGTDRKARELFVEMHRAEPRILETTESKLESINELLADRLGEMFQAAQFGGSANLSSASAAALLFVASDAHVSLSADVANFVSALAYQPAFYSALNGTRALELKKLLEAWVLRETDDPTVLAQNVSLALNQNLAAGRKLAIDVLKKDDLPGHAVQQAMSLLARSGQKLDAVQLERFLKDETVLAHFNSNSATHDVLKICDYAMAMMIQLTGNNPRDFRDGPLRWGQGWNADLQTLAFRTEEDRQAALKKWHAWWLAHKDKLGKE
jgi:hypothetical protein